MAHAVNRAEKMVQIITLALEIIHNAGGLGWLKSDGPCLSAEH